METDITSISLKHCIGKEVIDNAGNKCGTIKDFLVNPEKSNVPFVLLAEGGFLGTDIDSDYLIAPVHELRLDNPNAAQYSLRASQKKLKEAPKFPKSGIKDKDNGLLQKIKEYYGLEKDFIRPGRISKEEYRHQSYEGSSQITGNAPSDNQKISDEVAYDKIKGIDKKEGGTT